MSTHQNGFPKTENTTHMTNPHSLLDMWPILQVNIWS